MKVGGICEKNAVHELFIIQNATRNPIDGIGISERCVLGCLHSTPRARRRRRSLLLLELFIYFLLQIRDNTLLNNLPKSPLLSILHQLTGLFTSHELVERHPKPLDMRPRSIPGGFVAHSNRRQRIMMTILILQNISNVRQCLAR